MNQTQEFIKDKVKNWKEKRFGSGGELIVHYDEVEKWLEEYAEQKVKNLVQPDVSGNEALRVAFAFAKWIGRKLEKDSWFSHRDNRWYVHLHGHLTTEELFELYKEQTGKSK